MILLNSAQKISDQNPMGSALLGFETMKYNVVAAQMSRGKLEKTTAFAMASLVGTLVKLSSDICLYMNENFNFLGFPKELTTGSSIMPHKQNPDVFELMRARCNQLENLPIEIMMITNNLSSGYHWDFQLLKAHFMEGVDMLKDNLEVCNFMLQHVQVKENILDNPVYDYPYSVEEVNKLVMEGMSFREAYQKLGKEILAGDFNPDKKVAHTHQGSIGNLCLKEIRTKFDNVMVQVTSSDS